MNAALYIQILERPLVPFLQDVFPDHHRFMQDNDPKHCSKRAKQFFLDQHINWMVANTSRISRSQPDRELVARDQGVSSPRSKAMNKGAIGERGSSEKNGPGQKRKQQSHGNVPVLRPHYLTH